MIELEKDDLYNNTVDNIFDEKTAEGHQILTFAEIFACQSPMTVQQTVANIQLKMDAEKGKNALKMLQLPAETRTDLVLPGSISGLDVAWSSSNESAISSNGVLFPLAEDTPVTLTATISGESRSFEVKALARDIAKNLRYSKDGIDQTKNTASGFDSNTCVVAPEGLLDGLRSYTFLLTVNIKTMTKQPRLYDFGSGSGNSLFLRADALAAGIKYNGGTTTMVSSNTKLKTGTDYKLAVTYDAATRKTTIYIDGKEDVSGTANQNEAYQLAEIATDSRNYIGRTQWWDGAYKADNQDFCGTIDGFRLYDVCLTQKEICEQQGLPFDQKELPTALQNGDFEGSYSVQAGSGVSSDRAIYVPEGWNVDRSNGNSNDITALRTGDFYFDRFFGELSHPDNHGNQTYWIRQNWGTPTLTLSQELRLPEGKYTFTCDLWKNGLGGDAMVSIATEGGSTVKSESLENKAEWQHLTLNFESNGEAATTISLAAIHNSDGSEKIIGWDNVVLTKEEIDAIESVLPSSMSDKDGETYDLSGRRVTHPRKGIYIQNNKKIVVK